MIYEIPRTQVSLRFPFTALTYHLIQRILIRSQWNTHQDISYAAIFLNILYPTDAVHGRAISSPLDKAIHPSIH
jgi:hypothetical protein